MQIEVIDQQIEVIDQTIPAIPSGLIPSDGYHSFDDLIVPLYGEAFAFACQLTGDADRAEDIVQDATLRALRVWDRWVPDGASDIAARAWFYRIVAATFDQHARRRC